MARSFVEITTSMINYIKSLRPNLDTSEGTDVNDIVIRAPGRELTKLSSDIEQVSQDQSILTAVDSGLAVLGSNVSLQRKGVRRARGTVRFFAIDLPITDVTIPAGTLVSVNPQGNSEDIQFTTISAVTMYSSLATTYFNPDTGVYEIPAEIEAVAGGTQGVVGAETINTIVTPIGGINGCYNAVATSGGLDIEGLDRFRARIASKTRGNSLGTTDGILSEVLSYNDVEDAVIVGGGDSERSQFGAIDIFVRGKTATPVTETHLVTGSPDEVFYFNKQPVIPDTVGSVISSASGSIGFGNFSVVQDTDEFAGSINGKDYIQFTPQLTPSYGVIVLSYSYNSLVESLQNIFTKTNKQIQNASILVQWATELFINVTTNIKILPGYDSNVVIENVEVNLSTFFSNTSIGEQIQQADVAKEILNTPGVDDLLLPFTVFESSDGSIVRDTFGNLNIPAKAYAVVGDITLNVVV